ncbi:MAG: hypothetical protein JSS77_16105 [Acidobacteria bacterium]|nr:hypothetical protein [Acidobacteriota bacterium]
MDQVVQLQFDIKRTAKVFERFGRQTNFAVARAITETVGFVRTTSRDRLGEYLKIRTNWMRNSIVTPQPATRDRLIGTVGVRKGNRGFDLAPLLVEGGEKMPHGDTQGVPKMGADLPTVQFPRGAAGERTTLRGQNWPGQMLLAITKAKIKQEEARHGLASGRRRRVEKAGAAPRVKKYAGLVFLEHAAIPTIAIRVGGRKAYKPLWFLLDRPVHIKKKWPFIENGLAVINDVLPVLTTGYLQEILSGVRTT